MIFFRESSRHILKIFATIVLTLAVGDLCQPNAQAAIPQQERDALIALYNSTNGANWSVKTGWLGAAGTECSWHGVQCNEGNTDIISLDLGDNNLTGSIPLELGNLANLQYLWLQLNQLSGSIPGELGNLVNLQGLYLYSNQLSGSIPGELGNLVNLTTLYLHSNQLSGSIPAELGNLANLEILSLYSNQLSGSIPPELGNLVHLRYLGVNGNQLSGSIPAELGNLANLTDLELSHNQLSGSIPPELGNLANLTSLYLHSNQLSGSIPFELGNLANLQALWLGDNQLSGNIPPELGSLANLMYLYLDLNQLSGSIPAELGNLTNLTVLLLFNNQLSGSIPFELGNLENLMYLYLDSNQLSGNIPPELGNLANLTNLWLHSNQLSGSISPELGNLANLTSLSLSGNQLSGSIPAELGNLANLTSLSLSDNQLSGSIPAELGNLANLTSLYLHSNQLSGGIPPELGNLANLTGLSLSSNQLSGSIPPELGSLANLTSLSLPSNQLSGSIPPELGSLANLKYLQLSSNQLSGSIPPELGNLANLTSLNLFDNQLSGSIPPELGDLSNLYLFYLHSNQLNGDIPPQIANLNKLTWLDLSYNALYATDSGLLSFLKSKQPHWQDTQTIAPEDVSAAVQTGSSVSVSWTPILYTSDSGGYEVYLSPASGGPFTFAGSTSTKLESNLRISGLNLATTYYFAVRSVTDPHSNNQNTVASEYSMQASAVTNADSFSVNLPLSSGGTAYVSTAGDADGIQVGYAALDVDSGDVPYATAVFSYKQDGVTVAEAGVPASPPTTHASIFVDYRDDVDSIPSHSEAGQIDVNTGIAVVNTGSQTANITYTLHDTSGNIITSGTETVDAGGHLARYISEFNAKVDGFALPVDFQYAIQFGTLEITSDQPLSILALRMTINQRDEVLFTTTPVADLTQPLTADPFCFAQFADGGGYTSSLILLNTSNATETGTLQILDNYGFPLSVTPVGDTTGSSFLYSVEPGGVYLLQTDGFPVDAKTGWVRLTPDGGTSTPVGSGLFGYNENGVLVSESGVPAALSTTHARVYVDLTGNHNTGLAIANVVATQANIEINAFQKDGITAIGTSMGPLELSGYGHAAKFANQFVAGLPAGFTGVLDISSTTPYAALTMRSLDNERGDFLFTTFPVADMTRPAPSPIIFPQIADSDGYVSEFILLGSTGASTSTLSFYDNSGDPLEFEN